MMTCNKKAVVMEENIMYQYIKECEEEYKDLFGIEHFPEYEIKYKELGLEKAEQQGYDSFATAFYDIPTGRHTLEIWSKLYTLKTVGKAVVFHELTHIYDDDVFVGNDKMRYLGNHAYEEYHASQVELMKMLRVKDLDGTITFSMQEKIDTVTGTKSINEYVGETHKHVTELINRMDFPANIDMLKSTLGIIFNYYGRRSICKMYATDYIDSLDNAVFKRFLTPQMEKLLNSYMEGWFDTIKVEKLCQFYQNLILVLVHQYGLNA